MSIPRKPSIAQFVMGHNDYEQRVNLEFDERVEEEATPAKMQMALRCRIAKELFDTEDAETQQRLRQENEDTHNALVAAAEQSSSQPLPTLSAGEKKE